MKVKGGGFYDIKIFKESPSQNKRIDLTPKVLSGLEGRTVGRNSASVSLI